MYSISLSWIKIWVYSVGSAINLRFESVVEGNSSAQKRVFKYTLVLFLMHLHTCAVELLYKCNIALIAVRLWLYTLTGHFIRYTLLVPGWTPFCLQNCLNSSWHRFNKVLETFLRDFGPYWHDSITQLLQICWLLIHDGNLPFHHTTKVLYWIEICWLWRPFE